MRIVTTSLVGWRNYEQQSFEFTGSPTILLGPNGQGKTNFVEALVYVALGRSHRTALDSVLVGAGHDHAIVRVVAEHAQRRLTVDVKVTSSGGNEIRLNGVPTKRKDVVRLLPLVLFAPEDLDIVRGDPEQRRSFLADLAIESAATQVADLAEYDRVLRQRNSLLKTIRMAHGDNSTLDTWTDSLVQVGARVMIARRRIVEALEPLVAAQYSAISSSDDRLTLQLAESIAPNTPDDGVAAALADAYAAKRADEIERGTTLIGPHRDDLIISLNGLAARTHSSQGEAWSCALALRLAMIDFLRERSAVGDPVVILDDVFAELDPDRRKRLGDHVHGIEHLIITTADESTIPSALSGVIHRVAKGRIDE